MYYINLLVLCLIGSLLCADAAGTRRARGRGTAAGTQRLQSGSAGQVTAPKVELNDGCSIPSVGMGTWQLGANDSEIARAISDALDVGYRHIDTAWLYGTERGVGQAVKQAMGRNRLKREDVFITSKVWNTYHRRAKVLDSIRQSLETLGMEYLDLALIHWPTGFQEGDDHYPKFSNGSIIPRKWNKNSFLETWRGMEDAVKAGLTRSIGVSNFNARQLQKLVKRATIKPAINQVECHPNLNQAKLLAYCNRQGIKLEAYAPLRRADKELLNDPVLTTIAKKYNKTAAQVAFRWQIQRGVIVIPKSAKKSRQLENIDIFDFQITSDEIKQIDSLPQKTRIYDIEGIQSHPDYPFTAPY